MVYTNEKCLNQGLEGQANLIMPKKRENVNLVYVSDCNSGLVNSCAHAVGVIVAALSNRRM